jgi:ABC-type multidrug transport system ATPase subunit
MSKLELSDPFFLPHHGCELSFELPPGELLVLWGENGVGKSTLLKRLYGELLGMNKTVVLIEQMPLDFFFDRTLKKVVDFFAQGELPGLCLDSLFFLLEEFGLAARTDRRLSHLSGGETQMLKLVLGLCAQRDYYFMDEPAQFLDPHRKEILARYLDKIRNSGKSVLMVEHDQSWIPLSWRREELKIIDGSLRFSL